MRAAREVVFRERARMYYAMIGAAAAIFLVLDLLWQEPALGLRAAMKVGVMVAAGGAWWLAGSAAPIQLLYVASIVLFSGIFSAIALVGVTINDPQTQTLLLAGTIVALAGVFPWGARLQSVVAAMGTAAWLVVLSLTHTVSPFAAALFLAFVWSSPLVAWTLESQWRAQWIRQNEASLQAQSESAIARALAGAGRGLLEQLGQANLMSHACRIMREALRADFVVTLVTTDDGTSLDAAAQDGLDDEVWETYGIVRVPTAIASVIRDRLEPTGLYLLDVDDAGLSQDDAWRREIARRIGLGPILLLALRSGGKLTGVVAACQRHPSRPFDDEDRRTARGLVPLVSASLENDRLLRALEAANQVQHELLAGMSHELRTPLNVILGYLEMLLDGAAGPLTERQRELCSRVRDSAAQQLALVGETLEISRRDAGGQVTVRCEPVDVQALFSELASELRVGRPRGPVQVSWCVDPGTPRISTDAIKLRMILRNLVENALRHTAAGEVVIRARLEGSGLRLEGGDLLLEVRDTGSGIPESQRERVFEAFLQGDHASKGIGLGLHIVRRLVDALGGSVALESREGEGARFTVRIPVSAVTAVSAKTSAASAS